MYSLLSPTHQRWDIKNMHRIFENIINSKCDRDSTLGKRTPPQHHKNSVFFQARFKIYAYLCDEYVTPINSDYENEPYSATSFPASRSGRMQERPSGDLQRRECRQYDKHAA